VVERRANQLATGLSLMFFGIGMSALIGRPFVGALINGLPRLPLPGLEPGGIGARLLSYDILVYLGVPTALCTWWLVFRTPLGARPSDRWREPSLRRLRRALRPQRLQYQALTFAGALRWHCRSASVDRAHLTGRGDDGGRGFIAVALVIFAKWIPLWGRCRRAPRRCQGLVLQPFWPEARRKRRSWALANGPKAEPPNGYGRRATRCKAQYAPRDRPECVAQEPGADFHQVQDQAAAAAASHWISAPTNGRADQRAHSDAEEHQAQAGREAGWRGARPRDYAKTQIFARPARAAVTRCRDRASPSSLSAARIRLPRDQHDAFDGPD